MVTETLPTRRPTEAPDFYLFLTEDPSTLAASLGWVLWLLE